jgi:hypothetical protein
MPPGPVALPMRVAQMRCSVLRAGSKSDAQIDRGKRPIVTNASGEVRVIGGEHHLAAWRRRGALRLAEQRVHLESTAAVD